MLTSSSVQSSAPPSIDTEMADDGESAPDINRRLAISSSSQVEEGEASMTEDETYHHIVRAPLHAQAESSRDIIQKMASSPKSKPENSLTGEKDRLIEALRSQTHPMEITRQQSMAQQSQTLETRLPETDPPGSWFIKRATERIKDSADDGQDTETILRKQFEQEKVDMELRLNQALQTADTLRSELTKYRRSITEDHLVLEDLKGERNQLRQEVAQLKRKSQLIVSIPRNLGSTSSLSLFFNKNSNNSDKEAEDGSINIKESSVHRQEKRRSSLLLGDDALVIQQLKEERDHLQSQLDEAHQQIRDIKAAAKQAETEDKSIIQELQNERNELRDKLARATNMSKKRKSISTHTTMDESSRQSQSLEDEAHVDDEMDALVEQLKQERNILQSRLVRQAQESKQQELVIQQLIEEREELRMNLLQESSTKLGGNQNNHFGEASLELPSLDGSFPQLGTIDNVSKELFPPAAQPLSTPIKTSFIVSGLPLPPSGVATTRRSSVTSAASHSSRSVSSSAKLNELRAHKHSVETHLKSMVSPDNPKKSSLIGNLQKELSTNQQIIQEQKFLLHQSQTKQKSHERIIAEQKIQLRLLAHKIQQGVDASRNNWRNSSRAERLGRWKNRMQRDIEEKFDALLEQYSRQLDYVDREYDVLTYTVAERHLPDGGGLFFWLKVLFIFLLWNFRS